MKNMIYRIGFLLAFTPLFGQDDQVKDPKAQEKINAARIAFITERLGLTPDEAEKFWPVYREFATKRTAIKAEFENARRNPDPKRTKEENERYLLDLNFQLKQRELDLEREYSGRILSAISPQKLIALRQAEQDFRNMIIKQIQQRQLQEQRRQQFQERNEQRLRQRNN
ncbi:hypothetical protein QQ054_13875 [Oscillatoria amoena NRMC-F 0135]|nr:hypothetical protein [Oscillatoria amoena NRMC-F 0135]